MIHKILLDENKVNYFKNIVLSNTFPFYNITNHHNTMSHLVLSKYKNQRKICSDEFLNLINIFTSLANKENILHKRMLGVEIKLFLPKTEHFSFFKDNVFSNKTLIISLNDVPLEKEKHNLLLKEFNGIFFENEEIDFVFKIKKKTIFVIYEFE